MHVCTLSFFSVRGMHWKKCMSGMRGGKNTSENQCRLLDQKKKDEEKGFFFFVHVAMLFLFLFFSCFFRRPARESDSTNNTPLITHTYMRHSDAVTQPHTHILPTNTNNTYWHETFTHSDATTHTHTTDIYYYYESFRRSDTTTHTRILLTHTHMRS